MKKMNKPQKPLSTCLVCGDYSDYKFFSVPACHGCTNFFKRTINMDLVYVCLKGGNCLVDVSSRLRCRHCRFEKCKAMGMVYEKKKKVEEAEIRQVPNHRAHYQDQVQAQEQYVLEVHDLPVHWVLEEYQDFVAEEDLFDPEPEEEDPDLQEYMFGEVQEVIAFANTCQVFRSMTNLTKRQYLLDKWPQLVFIGLMEKGFQGTGRMIEVQQKFVRMQITKEEYEMLKTVALCNDITSNTLNLSSLCRGSPRRRELLKLIEDTVPANTRRRSALDDRVTELLKECFPS